MAAPQVDKAHWLFRLTADQWLLAARNELQQSQDALTAGQASKGMVLARRAAGMALNAVLVHQPNEAWQRSYMEHIVAVSLDSGVPPAVAQAALALADRAAQPLLKLGGGVSAGPARAAEDILAWCEAELRRLRQ